jgi:hypothetical protein
MIDAEEKLCQKLAKEFNIDVREIIKIQRSQFKQIANTMRAKEGKSFALPYLGEFTIIPSRSVSIESIKSRKEDEHSRTV